MSSWDQAGVKTLRKPYSRPKLVKQAKLAEVTAVLATASGAPPAQR